MHNYFYKGTISTQSFENYAWVYEVWHSRFLKTV